MSILEQKIPAKVVDNDDPEQAGRVRVFAEPIHKGIDDQNLPWAIPVRGRAGANADKDQGSILVPQKESWVFIDHEIGSNGEPDPNKPRYYTSASFKDAVPKRFKGEEDDIYDQIDSNLVGDEKAPKLPTYPTVAGEKYGPVLWELDYGSETRYLIYVDGSRLEFYPDGSIVQHAEGDIQEIAKGDKYINVGKNFEAVLGESWKITIGSDTIEFKSGVYRIDVGGATLEIRNGQIFLN